MKKLDEKRLTRSCKRPWMRRSQNALSQAKLFSEAVGLNGITLNQTGRDRQRAACHLRGGRQVPDPDPLHQGGRGSTICVPFVANDFIEALFSRDEWSPAAMSKCSIPRLRSGSISGTALIPF